MFEAFKKYACKSCHYVGRAKLKFPGSAIIELFLWVLFILPGLFYTMWRRSSGKWVCSECGSPEIIGAGTPLGKRIVAEALPKAA